MAKKTAAHRLDEARAALVTASKQFTELEAQRNAALLKDDDELAAELFGKLKTLHAAVRETPIRSSCWKVRPSANGPNVSSASIRG